jgi:hypothetical protein
MKLLEGYLKRNLIKFICIKVNQKKLQNVPSRTLYKTMKTYVSNLVSMVRN